MNSVIKFSKIINLLDQQNVLHLESGENVEISEYSELSISMDFIDSKLQVGQLVLLVGMVETNSSTEHFEAISKITSRRGVNEEMVRIEFQLKQYPKTIWNNFLNSKKEAQIHVDSLLSRIKGNT